MDKEVSNLLLTLGISNFSKNFVGYSLQTLSELDVDSTIPITLVPSNTERQKLVEWILIQQNKQKTKTVTKTISLPKKAKVKASPKITQMFNRLTINLKKMHPTSRPSSSSSLIDFLINSIKKRKLSTLKKYLLSNSCRFYGKYQTNYSICRKNCKYYHFLAKHICFNYDHYIYEPTRKYCSLEHCFCIEDFEKFNKNVKSYDSHNEKLKNEGFIKSNCFKNEVKSGKFVKKVIKSSGVIPYYYSNGKVFVVLGFESRKSGRFRFFGGKRDVSVDVNCIDTALREFCEESYGVFDHKLFNVNESLNNLKLRVKGKKLKNHYEITGQHQMFLVEIQKNEFLLLFEAMEHHKKVLKLSKFKMEKNDFVSVEISQLYEIMERKKALKGKKYTGNIGIYEESFLKEMKGDLMSLKLNIQNNVPKPILSLFPMYLKEACVGSFNEALEAFKRGANRIELCSCLNVGGITPSIGTITITQKKIGNKIPINVIIRPRCGKNFCYTKEEIEIMKVDILECKRIKVNGVVFGVLNKRNQVDFKVMKELVKIAKPLKITFHMAFDKILRKQQALQTLVKLGVDRVLTKGGKTNALNNKEVLRELVAYSNKVLHGKITIMPGGGVTKDNLVELMNFTKAFEFHGTKIV